MSLRRHLRVDKSFKEPQHGIGVVGFCAETPIDSAKKLSMTFFSGKIWLSLCKENTIGEVL